MRTFSFLFIAIFLPTLLWSGESLPNLDSDGLMRSETRWVIQCIEQVHYSKKSLDKRDMGSFIEAYIEAIDFHHLYFLRSEIDGYIERFGPPMARYLRAGNLFAAFEIYRDFRERVESRREWVSEFLDGELGFDEDDFYDSDRAESGWPESADEMESLWERRIKAEVLNEVLARMIPVVDEIETEEGAGTVESGDAPMSYEEALVEAKREIAKRYERWAQIVLDYEATDVQEVFLGELAREFDPHSSFLSSDQLEDFSISMANSLVGIGAVLESVDGICRIRELLPGGPADLSGDLGPGDEILGVAQSMDDEFNDVINQRLRKIVKQIRGSEGTLVRLLVRPAGADPSVRREVRLIRDRVKLTANLARAEVFSLSRERLGMDLPDGTTGDDRDDEVPVGVIYLPSFYGSQGRDGSNSADDVRELIRRLKSQGVEGIILDLRRNGGGLLSEAVRLTGLFIPDGPIVQVRDTLGDIRHHDDLDPSVEWDGPLVVLVSRYSASASEIVAGALQVHARAIVAGDRSTHGKGTVQTIFEMNTPFLSVMGSRRGGAAKVTIQKFYLPDGASTQNRGVEADIVFPSLNEYLPIGESDIDNALLWDEIHPTDWTANWGEYKESLRVDRSLVDWLRSRSEDRRAEMAEFQRLEETISYFREERERTMVSLNFEERLTQRQERKVRQERIDAEWKDLEALDFAGAVVTLSEDGDGTEGLDSMEDRFSTSVARGLDVPLREGMRILFDWIAAEKDSVTPKGSERELQTAALGAVES